MSRGSHRDKDLTDLDALIEEILVDAYGDDEQLWAIRQAFEDNISLPADAFVIGEPVSVVEVDYDGNERRGLTATCLREHEAEYIVAASEVVFPEGSSGARYVAAYRKWLGLNPHPVEASAPPRRKREHKAKADDLDLSKSVDLVALSIKQRTARCRLLENDRVITLRASRLWNVAPGEIVTVLPRKQWRYAGHPYLSGEIESTRLDAAALGLVPLRLENLGIWDPREHYWGEEDWPLEDWVKPIMVRGPRPQFEMEQVLPGEDSDDPFSHPIIESNHLKDAGDLMEARKILMELCQADLRCLDAHAHLGNFVFDLGPLDAIRHYEVGFRIGELSLGGGFEGVLPWGYIDNRPFLRCMHGYGLCLWRLSRFDEAERIFERMLWLNPWDNQGVRFLIEDVRAGKGWEEHQDEGEAYGGSKMELKILKHTPPWDWPEEIGKTLLGILRDDHAEGSERLLAAELAGDFTVINEELVDALLSIVRRGDQTEKLRGRAAISLGPVLEQADIDGFEDPEYVPISEETFRGLQESLRKLYMDTDVAKDVRRRILEASVRAPRDWHEDAVSAAYSIDDPSWRLTAVFCMRFIPGFDDQIIEALKSENPDIYYEAICAAGNWGLDPAWSHVEGIVTSEDPDKVLLLAAINAVASIRPQEAAEILGDLTDSEDGDIAEAAFEALAMAQWQLETEDWDDDEEDELLH